MTRKKHTDPLLDYFSDLLTEADLGADEQAVQAPAEEIPEPVKRELPPESSPQPQKADKPLAKPTMATSDLSHLEELKREQLQKLLSRQVPTKAPEKVKAEQAEEEITEEEIIEEVIVEEEPALTSASEQANALMQEKLGQTIVEHDATLSEEEAFQKSINSVLEWAENGRPQWAQDRFDVLLFDVSGLTLAVPLIALGQIVNIGEELTPIFGQSDWFMGLLNSPQGQIKTVNTALFVMPEKYSEAFLESAKYVISIDGLPWGLAVDSVNQPVSIDPDEVRWRTSRSSRPWLAGTVKSAMCALIDIPQMGAMLRASDGGR